jgi:mediator of RNA polymerase II transcription subunit 31
MRAALAQRGFLEKPAFVNYLEYLLYWKDAKYAKFLRYPHCLFFLEQLQNEQYRMRVRTLVVHAHVQARCCVPP